MKRHVTWSWKRKRWIEDGYIKRSWYFYRGTSFAVVARFWTFDRE